MTDQLTEREAYFRGVVDAYNGPKVMHRVSLYSTELKLTHMEYLKMLSELGMITQEELQRHYPPFKPQPEIESTDERYNNG
jgi:hypothetical protein